MAKRTLGKKALTVVKKLGHKSTAVLSKIGAKAVGLSDVWKGVSSGEIDYRTKKDPVSFLSYFQRYNKGAKKVTINRGNGLVDSHMQKYLY